MNNIEKLTTDTIRVISAEGVQAANSGHPGTPMGAAPIAYTLWAKEMNHNPNNPDWPNRDRFVLSAGHASMLMYSLLHLFGYGLTIDDLKDFRQFESKTPGHPEYGHTVGVETTTGPLGQGFANAVGMAIAETHKAAKFNKPDYNIVDNYTYVLCGDGCMMEGITSEAASLAGTLKLDKLVCIYDSNSISIEGSTDLAFTEDVGQRFEAYGWQVVYVEDGNDIDAIAKAVEEAKGENSKPSLIIVTSTIGYGCPSKQGSEGVHGAPLGEEGIKETKEFFGFPTDKSFYVPEEVREHLNGIIENGQKKENDWLELFEQYTKKYPEAAAEWKTWHSNEVPFDIDNDNEYWGYEEKTASRASSGNVLNYLAERIPNFIGGSADLAPSNKSVMKNRDYYSAEDRTGSNMHFGVREFAMGAVANGMAVYGGLRPYVATFFVFSDYMKHTLRLAALMNLPVTYILTHDSIGVGEDGPTHQPVEHLASLRSIPNLNVFRPADSKEVAAAWYSAVKSVDTPTALVLTRQNLPVYENSGKAALKGGYILSDSDKDTPDMILMASGSEVELVMEAKDILKEKGIDARVVSIPCFKLFDSQSEEYKKSVLPDSVRARLAVEAGTSFGWYKYVGLDGDVVTMDEFGASGPAGTLFKHFGFTVENVVEKAKQLV